MVVSNSPPAKNSWLLDIVTTGAGANHVTKCSGSFQAFQTADGVAPMTRLTLRSLRAVFNLTLHPGGFGYATGHPF